LAQAVYNAVSWEARVESWLITGGAGFIGCNFVRLVLRETNVRIVVLDKLTYAGSLDNLGEVLAEDRLSFVAGDIGDAAKVDAVLREHRPTAVVNFAAESHVDRSIDGPRNFVTTNTLGAFELLDASRRFVATLDPRASSAFRFLQVSTDEVYGALGGDGFFVETTAYAPNSPYAASKAGADHLARAYYETYGLPTLITNSGNNYGPYQFPEKLVPLTILNAIEGRPLPIYGDGLYVRDWLHVDDHAHAILAVLKRGRPGQKYLIGAGNELPNLELVRRLCAAIESLKPAAENDAMRRAGKAAYHDLCVSVADRAGHDRRYAIDASKIRAELGWTPATRFDTGLRETVRWYLENGAWAEAVQRKARYERERLGLGAGPRQG
jgi:dTDP-glucose 4,6-dehydratase